MTRIRTASLAAVVLAAAAAPVAASVFTWSGLGANWSSAATWQEGAAPPSNINTAIVLTGTGNTTGSALDFPLTLNSLTFTSEAGPFTIFGLAGFSHFFNFASGVGGAPRLDQFSASNHTINLPDGIGLNANLLLGGTGTGSLTIDGPLLGGGRLILNGPYTVITTAATSFSTHGGTTLNAGTLRIEHELSLGGSAPIFGGGTLQLASSMILNKSITVNSGGGTIDANGFAFSITNGALIVSGAGRLALTSTAAAPGTSTIAARLQQTGGLLVTGAGHVATLTNTTPNTYTGGTTVDGGATLSIDADQRLGNVSGGIKLDGGTMRLPSVSGFTTTRAVTLSAGGGTFDTTAGPIGLNGVVSGSGGVKKIGPGRLRLLAANTYSGPTTVSAGFLDIEHNQAAQNSTVDLSGGTLTFVAPTPTLGGLAGSGNLAISGVTSLNIGNNNASTTYAGNLTGSLSGALGKMGSGIWTLTGTNTFSGQFAVQGGTVVAGSAGAISPNASITVSPGATLDLNGFNYNMTHASGITAFSGSTLRLNGAGLTIAVGSTGNFNGSVPMQFGTITTAAGATTAYSGAALSNGFIAGPGTQFVTGPNTFNNITVFNGATLTQSAGSVLNLNNSTLGGALTVGGTVNWTNGSVTSSGQVVVNSLLNTSGFSNNGTFTVNNGGTFSNTVSNLVSGGGSIVNVNAGGAVQLNGLALDLHDALAVNNGTIAGGTTNVYFGSLLAGTGSFGTVVLHPGGVFTPGESLAAMPAPAPTSAALITPLDPNQTTSAPIVLAANTTAAVETSDNTLTLSGAVTGTGVTLTKTGGGTLALTGNNTYTGGTTVNAGTLRAKRLHEDNAVTINAGILQVLESAPGLGTGHPSGDNASVSRPSSLSIAAGAILDLTNNDLILDYSGASPITTYEALVASGYNVTGDWQGDGITSSVAALDGNYVLAIADNAALAAPFGSAQGGPLFTGVDVDLTTILVKFTHRADINLDGLITPDDAAIFGGAYDESITSGHTWASGDMNYDGACTPDDAAIFGGAYDESLTSLPEPAFVGMLGLASLALPRRARRRVIGCNLAVVPGLG